MSRQQARRDRLPTNMQLPEPERMDFTIPREIIYSDETGQNLNLRHLQILVHDPTPTPDDTIPANDKDAHSDGGDAEFDDWWDSEGFDQPEDLTALDTFKGMLPPAVECGAVSLAYMSLLIVFCGEKRKITRPNGGLHKVIKDAEGGAEPEDESDKKERTTERRKGKTLILLGALGLIVITGVQIIIITGLALAMSSQISDYNRTGAPLLCPGQTSAETLQAMGVEDIADYTAGTAENIVMVASIIIIVILTCYEMVASYESFSVLRETMDNCYPKSIEKRKNLLKKNNNDAKENASAVSDTAEKDPLIKAWKKYSTITEHTFFLGYVDLLLHVVVTTVIYVVTLLAIFFMGSAGKMVAAIFAATFLSELDDNMVNFTLDHTPLCENLYHLCSKANFATKWDKKGRRYKPWMLVHHALRILSALMFLLVFALALALIIWTFRGCKPGQENEFEYF